MKIGLLGSGVMGQKHLAACAALPGIEMVTRDNPSYAQPAGELDQQARESLYRAMIADPSVDAIDICLPTPWHPQIAIAALQAGKHVLCEKPLALSTDECARMLTAARQSGRVFMVAHVLRFFPAYRQLAEAVRRRQYGTLRSIRFTRCSGYPARSGWLAQPEQCGSAVLDMMVHDFDQTIALFGPPAHLTVASIESEDTVRCTLGYDHKDLPAGLSVEIAGGWFRDGRAFSHGFHARFDEAELIYDQERLSVLSPGGLPQQPSQDLPLPDVDPYAEQLRYFIACCRSQSEPVECPPAESAAAVSLALAARDLLRSAPGTWQKYS